MFEFLDELLKAIRRINFNSELSDLKTVFSNLNKSDSNSNKQPAQDKSSELIDPFLGNDVLPLRSETSKQDLENHISNIWLLDNPDLSSSKRLNITQKLISIEDLYKIEIKGIESTPNQYQTMKCKDKSDQCKFYLDNEGIFQLTSDMQENDAIFNALIKGDPALIQIASQNEIDLDILHQHKKTIRRSSDSIYALIQDHPDQNAKLLFAIKHNDLELVDIALKNGASIKVLTENKDILRYISNSTDLIDYFQYKYLFASVERPDSNLEVLKKELSDFWKAKDGDGNTLLHLACQQGNEAVITKLLIAEDIDIGIKNEEGKIALELIENKDLKSSICQMALTLQSTIEHDSETLLTIKNILKSITDPLTNISLPSALGNNGLKIKNQLR